MRIVFLGTGAATSCPLAFCRCAACARARALGGKDFRLRASVLIDGALLIDMNPDLMSASFRCGADVSAIRYWLQTHSHSDHFDAGHLITRIAEYASENVERLELCASGQTISHMSGRLAGEEEGASLLDSAWLNRLNISARAVSHGDAFEMGEYRVTAIESAHDISDGSLIYAIERGGKSFLYATDTVELTERAWNLLARRGFAFDAIAIDHTYGPATPGGGHLCADQVAKTVARMRGEGILRPSAPAFATHISHEGMPLHDELAGYAREHGYDVAWDGLAVEL